MLSCSLFVNVRAFACLLLSLGASFAPARELTLKISVLILFFFFQLACYSLALWLLLFCYNCYYSDCFMCGFKLKFIIITVNLLNNLWYTRSDANKHLFSRNVCGKMQIRSFIINTFGDMSVNSAKELAHTQTQSCMHAYTHPDIIQKNWFYVIVAKMRLLQELSWWA